MKSRMVRHATKSTLFAGLLLTACLFGTAANAQSGLQGRFTLPFEARWGQAVLPPGDYQLTFVPFGVSTELVIRDANSLRPVALEPVNVRENGKGGRSTLLIDMRGNQPVVYSLTIAELSEAFVYERPAAQARPVGEAGQTRAVAVLVTKK
jgi:hypothetical protein